MRTILLAISLVAFTPQDYEAQLKSLVKSSGGSVAALKVYDSKGLLQSEGSAFVVAPFSEAPKALYVVTNRHVVRGASKVQAVFPNQQPADLLSVVAEDIRHDLVVLLAEKLPEIVTPLEIVPKLPDVGQRVAVIGNPVGLSQTLSDGIVSSIRELATFGQVVQVTAPMSPGSSGSPVFSLDGKVIGVASFQHALGQNLNFAIPIVRLTALKCGPSIPIQQWSGEVARRAKVEQPALAESPKAVVLPENADTFEYWLEVSEREIGNTVDMAASRGELLLRVAESWRNAGQIARGIKILGNKAFNEKSLDMLSGVPIERVVNLYCDANDYLSAKLYVMGRLRQPIDSAYATIGVGYYGYLLRRASLEKDKRKEEFRDIAQIIEGLKNSVPPATFDQRVGRFDVREKIERLMMLGQYSSVMAAAGCDDEASKAVSEIERMEAKQSSYGLGARYVGGYRAITIANALQVNRFDQAKRLQRELEESAPSPTVLRKAITSSAGDPVYELRVLADRVRIQIGEAAWHLGAKEDFTQFKSWIDERLGQGQAIGDSAFLVEVLAQCNETDLALRVSQASGGPAHIVSIVVRFAELGDRRRAAQLLQLVPSRPHRAQALIRLADLAIDAADTELSDDMIGQIEKLIEEHWKEGRRAESWRSDDMVAAMVRFGGVKARGNSLEDLWRWWNSPSARGAFQPHRSAMAIGIGNYLMHSKKK